MLNDEPAKSGSVGPGSVGPVSSGPVPLRTDSPVRPAPLGAAPIGPVSIGSVSIGLASPDAFAQSTRNPGDDTGRSHYSIGELCDEFAVTARALRFYEDEALIAPERRGTTRLYSERDRSRLAWILRGKRVGLSLNDIKELLDLYDVGDGRKTQRLMTVERCQAQADKLAAQRIDIDATINELNQFIALVKAQDQEI